MIDLEVQIVSGSQKIPSSRLLEDWAFAALKDQACKTAEITLRIVDSEEISILNQTYRDKPKPTNVLSFVLEKEPLVGDVALCAPVIEKEAMEQGKQLDAHWAHLVIHGVLHLLGYDHILKEEADKMEALEIHILATLNFPNPYKE